MYMMYMMYMFTDIKYEFMRFENSVFISQCPNFLGLLLQCALTVIYNL